MTYWLAKSLLLIALVTVVVVMMRPVKNDSHLALRRVSFMLIAGLTAVAVIFPEVLHRLATLVGVESGVNLLVYILVLTVFVQMALGYRRDKATERKMTQLARAVALQGAVKPSEDE